MLHRALSNNKYLRFLHMLPAGHDKTFIQSMIRLFSFIVKVISSSLESMNSRRLSFSLNANRFSNILNGKI